MNKSELVEEMANRTGVTQSSATEMLDAVTDTITEALANGEEVKLVGFGRFFTKEVPERIYRNPQTGEGITKAAHTVAACKLSKTLLTTEEGA